MLLALGVGSLFNHSRQPNLDYRIDHDKLVINYFAVRDIKAEEELTIFYGHNLWFEDTSATECNSPSKRSQHACTLHEHMDNEQTFLGNMML